MASGEFRYPKYFAYNKEGKFLYKKKKDKGKNNSDHKLRIEKICKRSNELLSLLSKDIFEFRIISFSDIAAYVDPNMHPGFRIKYSANKTALTRLKNNASRVGDNSLGLYLDVCSYVDYDVKDDLDYDILHRYDLCSSYSIYPDINKFCVSKYDEIAGGWFFNLSVGDVTIKDAQLDLLHTAGISFSEESLILPILMSKDNAFNSSDKECIALDYDSIGHVRKKCYYVKYDRLGKYDTSLKISMKGLYDKIKISSGNKGFLVNLIRNDMETRRAVNSEYYCPIYISCLKNISDIANTVSFGRSILFGNTIYFHKKKSYILEQNISYKQYDVMRDLERDIIKNSFFYIYLEQKNPHCDMLFNIIINDLIFDCIIDVSFSSYSLDKGSRDLTGIISKRAALNLDLYTPDEGEIDNVRINGNILCAKKRIFYNLYNKWDKTQSPKLSMNLYIALDFEYEDVSMNSHGNIIITNSIYANEIASSVMIFSGEDFGRTHHLFFQKQSDIASEESSFEIS